MTLQRPTRRGLLAAGFMAPFWLGAVGPGHHLIPPQGRWAACWGQGDGRLRRYGVAVVDAAGKPVWTRHLAGRGHGLTPLPSLDALAVCQRRPGSWIAVVGLRDGKSRALLTPPGDRVLCGHAVATTSGGAPLLLTAETDGEAGTGIIGVWRAEDASGRRWLRLREIPTGGVEPHDLALIGDVLYVAHGGLRQTADSGRRVAVVEEGPRLPSDVAAFSWPDGKFLGKAAAPPHLSLRHLAWDGARLHVGAQAQPGADPDAPLLYAVDPAAETLTPWPLPLEITRRLAGYVGSVAAGADGRLAASSPRGGAVATLSAWEAGAVELIAERDVCALAFETGGLLLASGLGVSRGGGRETPARGPWLWDNHAAAL